MYTLIVTITLLAIVVYIIIGHYVHTLTHMKDVFFIVEDMENTVDKNTCNVFDADIANTSDYKKYVVSKKLIPKRILVYDENTHKPIWLNSTKYITRNDTSGNTILCKSKHLPRDIDEKRYKIYT